MSSYTSYQSLIDFFTDRELPTGPQHVNAYSVFLNLSGAVNSRLADLQSEVEATQKSAALMLEEVKAWLSTRESTPVNPIKQLKA